jgi:hypothetical protein
MRAIEGAAVDGWALAGFDVAVNDVRTSPLLHATTYWKTAARPNQVALRHLLVRDLVANGSFEWDFSAPGALPFGFPASVYHNRVPVSVEASEGHGNMLCMTRPPDEGVGLEGLRFGLTKAARLLVQGGDVFSPNESGFALGRRWFGATQSEGYTWMTSGPAASSVWASYAGAAERPAGASAVSAMLLNSYGGPGGKTCYADLYLFEAVPPDIPASIGSNTAS